MVTNATTPAALRQSTTDAKLDSWPLASEQILEGDPQASGCLLWKSEDSKLANGIWECTPGVFSWEHADETLCLVQGKVTVIPEGGEPIEIRPGDLAFFANGTKTVWRVEETVRKAFHLHSPTGLPF
jgi:uncharacterized protein